MSALQILLWVYIAFLLLGGFIGFAKAKSKASLIASTISAVVLALFALNIFPIAYAWIVLVLLAFMFLGRLAKTKKIMPSGMLVVVTVVTIVLSFVFRS